MDIFCCKARWATLLSWVRVATLVLSLVISLFWSFSWKSLAAMVVLISCICKED